MTTLREMALCGAVIALSASGASAVMTEGTWILDQSNTFADGVDYGTVQIAADSDAGTVLFTVTAAAVPTYGTLNKFGIQKFGFNYEGITSSPRTWDISLPHHWSQDTSLNLSGFGRFDLAELTSGANNRTPVLEFTITLPNPAEAVAGNFAVASCGNAGEGNTYFVAHVAGFGNGPGSHYIGGSEEVHPNVPEPSSALLLIPGLLVLCRRRSNERM